MAPSLTRRKVKVSFIIHFSRPFKALVKRFSLVTLVLLALFLTFISINNSKFSQTIRNEILDTISPIFAVVTTPINYINGFFSQIDNYFFVYERNLLLEKENQKIREKLLKLANVHNENKNLKKLLNYVGESNFEYKSAQIIGDTSGPFVKSILINIGSDNNIKKGNAVVNENGLVGRIIDVGKHSSRVLLITDINSKIPVISSFSRERSIMSGNNSEEPSLLYLPKYSKIHSGERLVTSGDGDLFPAGLQVGIVYSDNKQYDVDPFVRWNRIEHVSVLINNSVPEIIE